MADIIGGIATSHVPAIGAAMDNGRTGEDYWKPLFDGYGPARKWLADAAPDVAVIVYNDHANAMTLELIPTFTIAAADEFLPCDEGYGRRKVPNVTGYPELALHLAERLVLDEFDITIANRLEVDHGLTVPLSIVCGQPESWPFRVIPLPVNVIKYPQPTGNRCYNLGRAMRKAITAWPEDLRVLIMGTGGMSHQLQGERAGLINSEFDKAFLDDLSANPERLINIGHTEYLREAGSEGIELIMWLIMRGCLSGRVREVYRHYHVPASNTGAGLIILEEEK